MLMDTCPETPRRHFLQSIAAAIGIVATKQAAKATVSSEVISKARGALLALDKYDDSPILNSYLAVGNALPSLPSTDWPAGAIWMDASHNPPKAFVVDQHGSMWLYYHTFEQPVTKEHLAGWNEWAALTTSNQDTEGTS